MLRSSSASRVRASGSRTGRSTADIIGAVTSRMMTSTSATSMIGVTLTLVMSKWGAIWRERTSASDHRDLGCSTRLGLVEDRDEASVGHVVVAADHDGLGRAHGQERPEEAREPRSLD